MSAEEERIRDAQTTRSGFSDRVYVEMQFVEKYTTNAEGVLRSQREASRLDA
jgi:hypothetical protein